MADWIDVIPAIDLPPAHKHAIFIKHKKLLVCNVAGEYYAIEDLCSHDGGPLSDGWMANDEIICPRHGARFCIKTGEVTAPPAYESIETFPTRLANGMVQVFY